MPKKIDNKFLRLRSSILEKGPKVTQIIHFVGGEKKTFHGIYGDSVVEGSMVHFQTDDGRLVLVNPKNVLCVEVFKGT